LDGASRSRRTASPLALALALAPRPRPSPSPSPLTTASRLYCRWNSGRGATLHTDGAPNDSRAATLRSEGRALGLHALR